MRGYLHNFLILKSREISAFRIRRFGVHPKYFNSFACLKRNESDSVGFRFPWNHHRGDRSSLTSELAFYHTICSGNVTVSLTPNHCDHQRRWMAGHAKWQNIKHTKLANDQEKSRRVGKFVHLVRAAVRSGGPDPKYNTTLKNVLAEAQKQSVALSSLESAMKKTTGAKTKCGIIEIPGPGGMHIIVEYETDNVGTFRHAMKQVLKKYVTAILSTEGRWRSCFEQKGIVKVIGKNYDTELNAEQALDSAIEAGAEDVQLRVEGDTRFLEFICDPADVHSVKKELESVEYKVEEAYVAYIPTVTVTLSGEAATVAENLLSEIEDVPDVVRVYENMQ